MHPGIQVKEQWVNLICELSQTQRKLSLSLCRSSSASEKMGNHKKTNKFLTCTKLMFHFQTNTEQKLCIQPKPNQFPTLYILWWRSVYLYADWSWYCTEKEVYCCNASFPPRSRSTFYAQQTQSYLFAYINNQLLNYPDTADKNSPLPLPEKTISCSY